MVDLPTHHREDFSWPPARTLTWPRTVAGATRLCSQSGTDCGHCCRSRHRRAEHRSCEETRLLPTSGRAGFSPGTSGGRVTAPGMQRRLTHICRSQQAQRTRRLPNGALATFGGAGHGGRGRGTSRYSASLPDCLRPRSAMSARATLGSARLPPVRLFAMLAQVRQRVCGSLPLAPARPAELPELRGGPLVVMNHLV